MYNNIICLENLFLSWQEFRRGKRGKQDVQKFERYLENNIFQLHNELIRSMYYPGSYHRFHIFDPKHRIIHKALVRDRLVHHAVYRVLYPIIDKSFIFDSYSCRIGKGTHAAVNRLEVFVRKVSNNYTSSCWTLKFDIKKFFDSVDHEILMQIIINQPLLRQDQEAIDLLEKIVGSYLVQKKSGGGSLFETKQPTGLPIGNLTSQLFANVYMDAFDHFVKETLNVKQYLRYTDDAVIVHQNQEYLRSLIPVIQDWLWQYRRLRIHPNKTEIIQLRRGVDFLGYVTRPYYRVLRTKTKKRMFKRVDPENIFSYLGLLKHCSGYNQKKYLRSVICQHYSCSD